MHESGGIALEDAKDPELLLVAVRFRRDMMFHALEFSAYYYTGRIVGGPLYGIEL